MKGVILPFEPAGHCFLSMVAGVRNVCDLTDKHQRSILALTAGMAAAQKMTEVVGVILNDLQKVGIVVVIFELEYDMAVFRAFWEALRHEAIDAEQAAAPAGKRPTHFHSVRQ